MSTRQPKSSQPAASASATSAEPARVIFVGAGPGDHGLITVRGAAALAAADVVVLDVLDRADLLRRYAAQDVEIVAAGHGAEGQQLTHAMRAKVVADRAATLSAGQLLVRLVDGDIATFSGFVEEVKALRKKRIPFDAVPGVSATTAVPLYAGVPLTGKDASSVHVVTTDTPVADWSGLTHPESTVVILGAPAALPAALASLLAAGRDAATPVAVTEHGTTNSQVTYTTILGDVADLLRREKVRFPSLAVVSPNVALRDQLSWFENKPLFGWRVLVPRTQAQAGQMVERLEHYGASSDVVPTISVEPPRTPQQMERAVHGLVDGRYEWVGFTSVNAVKAVRERFEALGLDCRSFAGLKVAAVGGVTAEALREWGINPDLVPSGEHSAAGLLEDWPDYDPLTDPINRVLLPRADIATDTLVAGLREYGWEVDDVTAYRTVRAAPPAVEIRDDIKAGGYDAVVFTSSSTVRNLVGIAGKPHTSTVVACIGPATAKTAEEFGLRVDVLAPTAAALSLVDALAGHGVGLAAAARDAGEPVRRPSERRPASRRRANSRSL